MIKEGRFGAFEATAIIVILMAYKVLLTSARQLIELTATAAWITTIVSSITAFAGFIFIYLLLKKFPNRSIIGIFRDVYGRKLYFIPSLLVYLLYMYNMSITLREFAETLKSYILPRTPIYFIMAIALISAILSVILGLEVIVRMASLITPPLLVGYFLILILSANNYSVYNITPLLGTGIDMVIKHGMLRSSVYGDVFMLAVIATSMHNLSDIKKAGFLGIPLAGFLVSIGILAYNLATPYYPAAESLAPIIQLARGIEYGRFIQRLEPFSVFLWVLATLIVLGAYIFISLKIYCELFEIKNNKPLTPSVGMIILSLAFIPQNISQVVIGQLLILREYSWIIYFVLPILTLVVSSLKDRKGEAINEQ